MGDKGKGEVPKFEPAKDYEKMIKLQLKYLPKQLQKELKYRGEYDPKFIEQALGLQRTYDPRLATEQLEALQRRDPEWLAMHRGLGDKIREALDKGYVDPTRAKLYEATGQRATGDILRGTRADKETMDQMTQAILSRSPTLSYGEAQDMAAAVYTGQRGQGLLQQRQQAANQFLAQQSERGQALAQAGSYLSSPTITQMTNQIQGVSAPRAFGYVNPQAGQQGLQLGLQGQQFQYANQAMGGGSSNPWMNGLQGAVTGAGYGSVGGGYGMAGGAVTGGIAGLAGYPQFSDARFKTNISRTGAVTLDGIPIVEYDSDGKRWRGVLAQEVLQVRPDAVVTLTGGRLGVFYSKLGIERREVN